MNQFLTKKALRRHFLDWPVIVICFFFGTISLGLDIEYLVEREVLMLFIGMSFTALFVYPAVCILVRRIRVNRAREYARCLANASRYLLPFSSLEQQMPGRNAVANMSMLLRRNLLQGIYVDYERQAVVLNNLLMQLPPRYVPVKCLHCGAPGQALAGQGGCCEFCGSLLPVPAEL